VIKYLKKHLKKQLKGGGFYFGSWFQRLLGSIALGCGEGEAGVMVERVQWSRDDHFWCPGSRCTLGGPGTRYVFPGHAPADLFLLTTLISSTFQYCSQIMNPSMPASIDEVRTLIIQPLSKSPTCEHCCCKHPTHGLVILPGLALNS
jgi:hypothetical protein